MEILKDLEVFAKKVGCTVDELKRELEEIKKEYKVKAGRVPAFSDSQALAQLKARYALKHLKEGLRKERYPGLKKPE